MPFSGNAWDDSRLLPYREALRVITARHPDLRACAPRPNDTARVGRAFRMSLSLESNVEATV